MNWFDFPYFAATATLFWLISLLFLYRNRQEKWAHLFTILGIASMLVFTSVLWIRIGRPPMRTLGETRLWYTLFLAIIGYAGFLKWKYKWFLSYSLGMAILFLGINAANPETYDKVMMPALQSPWFVPHVIVYLFAYALLAASALVALKGCWLVYKKQETKSLLPLADNMVYLGVSFLTLGLLFGALWAKEAWGHYWTWDPKETWAFLTWLAYLAYIHIRFFKPGNAKNAFRILVFAFGILILCWFGVYYMPSAKQSVHTYSQQ